MNKSQVEVLVNELVEAGRHPKKTILESMKATGKEAFGCFPIYTPDEIIYAAGLLPVGMWGGQTQMRACNKYIQSFCCSILRANLEQGISGEYNFLVGVAIPTYCDSMKAILANWPIAVPNCKAIPLVYPQNRISSGSFDFIISQFEKFKRDLEALLGREITYESIEDSFAIYEEWRSTMRKFTALVRDYPVTLNPKNRHMIIKAAYFMDKAAYTNKIKKLMTELEMQPKEIMDGPKVVLTGLLLEPEQLLDVLVEGNYTIVEDDLAQESRQFRTPARSEGTAIERMAYRVIDLRGCTFFYEENKSRGRMLIDMTKKYDATGVIVCMFKFCDPEEFDYPDYKRELAEADVPMLYLEIEQQMDSVESLRTRIQSFAEIHT